MRSRFYNNFATTYTFLYAISRDLARPRFSKYNTTVVILLASFKMYILTHLPHRPSPRNIPKTPGSQPATRNPQPATCPVGSRSLRDRLTPRTRTQGTKRPGTRENTRTTLLVLSVLPIFATPSTRDI